MTEDPSLLYSIDKIMFYGYVMFFCVGDEGFIGHEYLYGSSQSSSSSSYETSVSDPHRFSPFWRTSSKNDIDSTFYLSLTNLLIPCLHVRSITVNFPFLIVLSMSLVRRGTLPSVDTHHHPPPVSYPLLRSFRSLGSRTLQHTRSILLFEVGLSNISQRFIFSLRQSVQFKTILSR